MKKIIFLISVLSIFNSLEGQTPPPLQPGEFYTGLYSLSYDYQSNGSVRYIVQDPADSKKLCAILMADQDSVIGWQSRNIYYSYSFNNGLTWAPYILDASATYGFPCISLRNGIPIIAAHRSGQAGIVFKDLYFGGAAFQSIPGVPPCGIWPHVTGTTNGNIVLVESPNPGFTGQYTTYNGSSWTPCIKLNSVSGPSGNFSIESGTNGIVGIFGTNYNGNNEIYYYKSTDNGLTFDGGTLIFRYFIEGNDTLYANIAGGLQAVYINEEPHLAFAAYNINSNASFPNANTAAFIKPKILHWSPSMGIKQVAGKFNIPNLADTITTALLEPLCHPSIGTMSNGRLICTFTTFLRGNSQVVQNGDTVNAGEIFYSVSTNNGISWSVPINATNTPYIEEKYSSVPRQNNSDSLKCFYTRDMLAGNWVTNAGWGKAPSYGIYKTALANIVGINEHISEVNSFKLFQNYPNPFNPKTIINYDIAFPLNKGGKGVVSLKIYNALGREIVTLVNEKQDAGSYQIEFDGSNYPSGIYFYKLVSENFVETKAMILLK